MTATGIAVALYLSSTAVGAGSALGIQGRYFVPLVPFAPRVASRLHTMPPICWLHARPSVRLDAILALPSIALEVHDAKIVPAIVYKDFG